MYGPELGGHMPWHDRTMQTSLPGVFVAGDSAGVEEASTAMEEGRLAGIGAASSLGYLGNGQAEEKIREIWKRLDALRSGAFGQKRLAAKARIGSGEEAQAWTKRT